MTITTTLSAANPLPLAPGERQLTNAPHGHVLTNVNVWSGDGQWIVYDVRTSDVFNGTAIERVNTKTGEVQRLYTSVNGAGCGVVTHNPVAPMILFILGPENPTRDWQYGSSRRRGAAAFVDRPDEIRPLDAMNYAPPFTIGALRGGSHVHVFDPAGEWVSFTYEDEILARLDAAGANAPAHDPNQRNIGVSVPRGPVRVARTHPRNHDGDWFSVLVTRTVAQPRLASDDIVRACEEGWIGRKGYLRPDGTRQWHALAFQGTVTAASGSQHAEVYVVDLPDDLTQPGDRPLEGNETLRPAPPRGVVQRRITFTDRRHLPGVAVAPRHWMRCSPDGTAIAFLMKDEAGVVQLWTVSPNGGELRQITHGAKGIASAFTWSPDGWRIAHAMDGSVCVTDVRTGETRRLTPWRPSDAGSLALACVFSPEGGRIAYQRLVTQGGATYQQIFTVDVPPLPKP